jgi:hypothetical protein
MTDTIGIDPSIIRLKLSRPFSLAFSVIVFYKKLGVFCRHGKKRRKLGEFFKL